MIRLCSETGMRAGRCPRSSSLRLPAMLALSTSPRAMRTWHRKTIRGAPTVGLPPFPSATYILIRIASQMATAASSIFPAIQKSQAHLRAVQRKSSRMGLTLRDVSLARVGVGGSASRSYGNRALAAVHNLVDLPRHSVSLSAHMSKKSLSR
jgi:hypothetical protein